jgi:hypothetical protein
MHKTGETVTVQFCVSDPDTAGLVDADSLPTGVLVLNGANNAATVTVANVSTGVYSASVTLPTITDGDELQIRIAATVATVAGGGVVWQGIGCTKRPADVSAELAALIPHAIAQAQIDGAGAWYVEVLDNSGAAVAPASTALNSATWTGTKAGYLDAAITSCSSHAAADVAALILATPANKLTTNASGYVTFSNTTIAATVSDKTGFKLAADGLDSITATEPVGKPTTFRGWLMWLVQCFRAGTMTATTKLVKTEAGATVTTQTVSDDGTTETLGPPT